MGSGVGHPDLALYRLLKAGETGLNLRLEDLFDREIEIPNLLSIVRDLVHNRCITVKVKAYPRHIIEKPIAMQRAIDKEIKKEIDKAKRE